jgi:hypothetical protein
MMATATAKEEFEVTLLTDVDTTLSWKVIAETPEQAIEIALGFPNACAGIYSVWDPQDPTGMPLKEYESKARLS